MYKGVSKDFDIDGQWGQTPSTRTDQLIGGFAALCGSAWYCSSPPFK